MDLQQLEQIIADRLAENKADSYTVRLWQEGRERIAKKFGEEAVEALIEGIKADNYDKDLFVGETVDTLYHLLLLLKINQVSVQDIYQEMQNRHADKTNPLAAEMQNKHSGKIKQLTVTAKKQTTKKQERSYKMNEYDKNNIFARLLRGEVSCDKFYEDKYVMAFQDINPKAPVHALIIPKGEYRNAIDFADHASDAEIVGFTRSLNTIIDYLGVAESGYRLIANTGKDGMQEVEHYHVHVIGGKPLGDIVC